MRPTRVVLLMGLGLFCNAANGQQKLDGSLPQLERRIAEARGLSFDDDPGRAAAQIRQLAGIRALLASALVSRSASHRVIEIVADPARSRGERVLAAYVVLETSARVDYRKSNEEELFKRLARMYRGGTTDRLLRWPVIDVLLRQGRIDRRKEMRDVLRAGPWVPSHPVDVEMVRALLERLPGKPGTVFSGREYPRGWYGRIRGFFQASRTSVEAVEYMIQRHPEVETEQQAFLFGRVAMWVGDRLAGKQPLPQAIRDWSFTRAAELMRSAEPGWGAETALGFLMEYEFGAAHARLMVEAARKATDARWQKMLQDVIRGYIQRGEWPKGVSVDGVFSGKPPVAPRTTPRWRKRPEQMIIDEHPVLKHFPELRSYLNKQRGRGK